MLKSGISDGFRWRKERGRSEDYPRNVPLEESIVNTRRSLLSPLNGTRPVYLRWVVLSRCSPLAIECHRARFTPSERVERSASAKSRLIGLMSRASCLPPAATCIRSPDTGGRSEDSVATGFITDAPCQLHKINTVSHYRYEYSRESLRMSSAKIFESSEPRFPPATLFV